MLLFTLSFVNAVLTQIIYISDSLFKTVKIDGTDSLNSVIAIAPQLHHTRVTMKMIFLQLCKTELPREIKFFQNKLLTCRLKTTANAKFWVDKLPTKQFSHENQPCAKMSMLLAMEGKIILEYVNVKLTFSFSSSGSVQED